MHYTLHTLFCRYDVTSISPRQVEALIIDNVRLSEPAELRRVLHGARGSREWIPDSAKGAAEVKDSSRTSGKNGDDGEDITELLAALSRAVDEEVRGTKGLFGLSSGVLERLKSGVRLTPFLRHGSLRRRDPDKAAPGSLAAGGLKKWWRCPRCNLSQVRHPLVVGLPSTKQRNVARNSQSATCDQGVRDRNNVPEYLLSPSPLYHLYSPYRTVLCTGSRPGGYP